MDHQFYAYRSVGDHAGTGERTMDTDPATGEYPYLHAAGDVVRFDSEEERDAYVAERVMITTLGAGRDKRFHWVTALSPAAVQEFMDACATPPMCVHKGRASRGEVRIPE